MTVVDKVVLYEVNLAQNKLSNDPYLKLIRYFMKEQIFPKKNLATWVNKNLLLRRNPLVSQIKSRVLKLFGHIKRSQKGVSKICVEGKIPGKRGRGHPPTRWLDNVKKWAGLTIDKLNIATQDRGAWKDISHVGAQSAAGGESE